MHSLGAYFYFLAQCLTIGAFILLILFGCVAIITHAKMKGKMRSGKLNIDNRNEYYKKLKKTVQDETLDKFDLKKLLKQEKDQRRQDKKNDKIKAKQKDSKESSRTNNIFILKFIGDIRASAVDALTKEVSAILLAAKDDDEVLVQLDSGGGMVHAYGLAASQLQRIRSAGLRLTIAVDKIAASGGYMMAAVADHIIAAPFAIIGSIGVIAQLPNFHRWLDKHDIDYEQLTAGQYKRTLTMLGKNDRAGREKMQEELEKTHVLFKEFIQTYRPQLDLEQIATGEHWYGSQALALKLVDELITSEDWLIKAQESAQLYNLHYKKKQPLSKRLGKNISLLIDKITHPSTSHLQ